MNLMPMMSPPFHPVLPVPLIIALALAATLVAVGRAVNGRRYRPGWLHGVAVALRLTTIAALTVIFLNPARPVSTTLPESRSLILLDASASMLLRAPDGPSRWEDATQWTKSVIRAATAAGLPPPSIMTFGSTVTPAHDLDTIRPESRESNLSAALERVAATSPPPDQVIVVSDGRTHDRRALPPALRLARSRGLVLSTHAVGADTPPRNAWIAAVHAPRQARPRAKITLQVAVSTTGFSEREQLALEVKDDQSAVVARTDFRLPSAGPDSPEITVERTLHFDLGLRTGHYTVDLTGASDEIAHEDNRFAFTIEAVTSKLRVLFVEGTHVKRTVGDTGHAWNDIELMTRAWDASGDIEWDCVTPVSAYTNSPNLVGVTFVNGEMLTDKTRTFPRTREELHRYDVMLISDVPVGNFSTEQMNWVVDWVTERGAGFLMGGGYTTFDVGHYDQTPWEKITPVDMLGYGEGFDEQLFDIEIPKAVRTHPLWQVSADPVENEMILDAHPPFTGMNRIRRAKPGAIVLMTRPGTGGEPVMAAQSYGRGRSIAYLGDPNGGWARYLVSWGPPGGPTQGPHTELGHGPQFQFNEAAATAATGPPPPHPSPWYAQYWTNLVKWLGENSVRWRRDTLAGRVTVAQAHAGKLLPVAAEVPAARDTEELAGLDVGVRLDRPGSPRVRLDYDRDQREFRGAVPVPADVGEAELGVVFDAVVGANSFTDAVKVGMQRVNREFSDFNPDPAFLAELAAAGGGAVVETPDEAVARLVAAAESRAAHAPVSWHQPVWPTWPWWAAIVALLGLEWVIRRQAVHSVISQPTP